eukprot:scaffold98593_cov35-Tisochrysis_lutea.AAC.1
MRWRRRRAAAPLPLPITHRLYSALLRGALAKEWVQVQAPAQTSKLKTKGGSTFETQRSTAVFGLVRTTQRGHAGRCPPLSPAPSPFR